MSDDLFYKLIAGIFLLIFGGAITIIVKIVFAYISKRNGNRRNNPNTKDIKCPLNIEDSLFKIGIIYDDRKELHKLLDDLKASGVKVCNILSNIEEKAEKQIDLLQKYLLK